MSGSFAEVITSGKRQEIERCGFHHCYVPEKSPGLVHQICCIYDREKAPPSPAKNSQGGGRSHEFQNLRRQLLRKEIRNKCCDTWPPRRRVKRPCKNMEWLTIQWKGRSCRVENAIVCGEQPLLDDKGSHARRTPNESSRYVQRDRLDWGLTTKI